MKVKHPAPYTPAIVDAALDRLGDRRGTLVDPFAGIGRQLARFVAPGRRVIGFEIEKPWADVGAPLVRHGDSTKTGLRARSVATIFTSPTYGNRFADHHKAKDGSRRRSYTHDIRAMVEDDDYTLDANNTGLYQFGTDAYADLHRAVWAEMTRIAKPDALFLLNVSDIIRKGAQLPVVQWHLDELAALGWHPGWHQSIDTPRMKYGANGDARVDFEMLIELTRNPGGMPCRSLK